MYKINPGLNGLQAFFLLEHSNADLISFYSVVEEAPPTLSIPAYL